MDAIGLLGRLGFSEYEARTYATLLQRNPLTGYEVAKRSGIPRPNIYATLERLESRGALVRIETPTGAQYAPVPPLELLDSIDRRHRATLESAQQALSAITTTGHGEAAALWSIRGRDAVLKHARAVLNRAQRQLLVVLQPPEAATLRDELAAAEARGAIITTLCLESCGDPCGGCRGTLYRYRLEPLESGRWFIAVADDETLLLGSIEPSGEACGLRTQQPLIVRLAGSYVRRSIALATLVSDLGPKLDEALTPESQATLRALGSGRGFLDELRVLLQRDIA